MHTADPRFRGQRNAADPLLRERRLRTRGAGGDPDRSQLVTMIEGTYGEMPGLRLYANQAARLFGVNVSTCEVVLEDLVRSGHLRRGADGQYSKP